MRIACLLDDMFEDSEYQRPTDAFRQAGHDVVVIGKRPGADVHGYRGGVTAHTDLGLDEARPEHFDAVFIPGGYSPDHLRADPRAAQFAASFVEGGRPTFAICHGPQLLLTGRVVRGRTMTAWTTVQGDLDLGGARVLDAEVVRDGNLVTSRKPDDIPAFVRESLGVLDEVGVGSRR